MIYLIEHDKQDRPKTRWGELNGSEEEIIKALTTFCAAISDITDIYLHDHNGRYFALNVICDKYNIPYKIKEDN